MMDYIYVGSSPADEPCVQVSNQSDYLPAMRAECLRFIDHIRKHLGPEPDGARLTMKRESHDFGSYYEVVCWYDDSKPESAKYALKCESDTPPRWDAKVEDVCHNSPTGKHAFNDYDKCIYCA